jgi:two-component system sensor histidine kinase FlrB
MDAQRWLAIRRRVLQSARETHESANPQDRCIWILWDITEKKRAEREREAARHAATLAEISAVLAHEIRNPLASLELFAGLIAEEPRSRDQWISHLQAGIRTLSGTVNNVLSLNGGTDLSLAVVDLVPAVRNSVAFVQPIAQQAGVSIFFEETESSVSIEGNHDAIRQIILNLACNAIRHTPAGGLVEVRVHHDRSDGTRAIVTVTDTGSGIPGEHLDHLFDPGFSGTGGTPGLGLAVCRRLMTLHSGRITASSTLGRGSTFEVEFLAV